MCGRYSRSHAPLDYIVPLMVEHDTRGDFPPSWNVAPGTRQPVIRHDGSMVAQRWGYQPVWAKAKKLPPMINARLDKATGSAWSGLWKAGRVIVPADGWYEWIKAEDGGKQPYYIRPKDGAPLWMAGLTSERDGPHEGDGFVIVTAAADAGLVDVHDRRPVAFPPDVARQWLDPGTPVAAANELAHQACLPAEAFEWFQVSRDVNAVHNNEARLNARIGL